MKRSLTAEIDRLTTGARPTDALPDHEIAARYDSGIDPPNVFLWLHRQSWRRAHRAAIAGIAQEMQIIWHASKVRYPPPLTVPELVALAIVSTPSDEPSWSEAVRIMEIGSTPPTAESMSGLRPNMRRHLMKMIFTFSVHRIQIGGADGAGMRHDIAEGRYLPSPVGLHKQDFYLRTAQLLQFPGPDLEPFGGPWRGTLRIREDKTRSEAIGTGSEIAQRFSRDQAILWPP